MFLLKFPGARRRNAAVDEPLPPRERQNDEMPLGNITGLELLALFLSRQQQNRY